LIRPDEAVEHIGLLLANEQIDLKQRLLFIASVAIAGMIGLEGDSTKVGRIDGLQQGGKSHVIHQWPAIAGCTSLRFITQDLDKYYCDMTKISIMFKISWYFWLRVLT
jgi:hypothetical protein